MSCQHFEVVSPEIVHYSFYEPPEPFVAWAMIEASTKRAALIAAIKLPEFAEWVRDARGDRVPPFKGLTATRPVCEHGHCWGCGECSQCLDASIAEHGVAA